MNVVESSTATMEAVKLDLRFTGDTRIEPSSALECQISDKFVSARRKQLERFNDPDFDLPSMPPCVTKVVEISQSPDPSPRALEQVLQLDQALAAKILRMANSPIYGGTRRIDTLQSAITRLGVVSIRNVVLAIAVNSTIKSDSRIGPVANVLWEHSISTGIAAQVLAKRLRLPEQAAFLLGLMHDIGKLPAWILLQELLPPKSPVRHEMLSTLVEDSHCEIGEALIDAWDMSFDIRTVVGWHHSVTSLNALYGHILCERPEMASSDAKALAALICCVVLADRALGALKLAPEPGVFQIGGTTLATDLGLSVQESLDYLAGLPEILKSNDFRNM
ncbi:MAG: HDOD domain-containing protein [Planctomycetota bacterium]